MRSACWPAKAACTWNPFRDNTLGALKGCTLTGFAGPHPAGNVGVQIHHTAPINKGEVLWTMGLQDVINLGSFLRTGHYSAARGGFGWI